MSFRMACEGRCPHLKSFLIESTCDLRGLRMRDADYYVGIAGFTAPRMTLTNVWTIIFQRQHNRNFCFFFLFAATNARTATSTRSPRSRPSRRHVTSATPSRAFAAHIKQLGSARSAASLPIPAHQGREELT